jgi:hypothetical protein
MRSLLDFIFANLIPIIVVASIALRLIGGIKGRARGRPRAPIPDPVEEPKAEEEPYIDVWERLKPDDDQDGAPAGPPYNRGPGGAYTGEAPLTRERLQALSQAPGNGGQGAPEGAFSRPLLMPEPSGGQPPPAIDPNPVIDQPFEPVLAGPPPAAPPARESRLTGRAAGGPLGRVEALSPLRRAVVLAEILGPPRGLSNFPAG